MTVTPAAALALAINAPQRTPRLAHSIVAAEVYDLDARRVLYARNPTVLMVAASTTKLLTEGTSLALLGPDFRWTTPVYRTGSVDAAGRLHGDLVLVASGDPNLSQRVQPDGTIAFEDEDHAYDGSAETKAVPGDPLVVLRELAAAVSKSGIKTIDGRAIVDTSLFPDQGSESGTGVTLSSIVVNDNLVDVTVTPGQNPGDPVTLNVSPQTPYVTFVSKATTGARGSDATIDLGTDVTDAAGRHTVTVTGAQPAGSSVLYAYRVPDPKRFAQDAFAMALHDAGVAVTESPAAPPANPATLRESFVPANLVAQHVSPPLSAEVRMTLKVSDNLHAALMPYMWAAYVAHAHADYARAGLALEGKLLTNAGLDLQGASQEDGYGGGFFSPDFMVHYLAWVRTQEWYPYLFRGLPIMGVDGTLAGIQKHSPARGKVFAKTGTDGSDDFLTGGGVIEKGLAGYITTQGGHHVAFAFFISAMKGSHDEETGTIAGQILGAMAAATYEAI